MSLCENLYYLRKKAGYTQEALAEELQVSRQSVSKWETGEVYPETEKLIALCDIFGVTMDELVRGDLTETQGKAVRGDLTETQGETERREDSSTTAATAETDRKTFKRAAVHSSVCSCVFVCALIAFLVSGFGWGYWHVNWVSFIFALAVCSALKAFSVGGKQEGGTGSKLQQICASLGGSVMLLCVGIYLILGLVAGLWHPAWIIFLVGAVICIILGIFSGRDGRKNGDGGEKQ